MLCRQFVEPGERVLVLMGDQFIYNGDGRSEAAHLLKEVGRSGATAGMVVAHVPKEEVYKYGIVEVEQHDHGRFFRRIAEKPRVEEARSTLNNLGMYVFDTDMFDCLQRIKPTHHEYYLTDALNMYVQQKRKQLAVVLARGTYLDGGTVEGWLHANQYVHRHR
jgi:UTP-glucose-1-phosphate uridylyltransferase